jgi:hypothetical protein
MELPNPQLCLWPLTFGYFGAVFGYFVPLKFAAITELMAFVSFLTQSPLPSNPQAFEIIDEPEGLKPPTRPL